MFVADQTGEITVVEDGEERSEPFLDGADQLVDLGAFTEVFTHVEIASLVVAAVVVALFLGPVR